MIDRPLCRTGLLSRNEAWQARTVGELEQLKQNIRHFIIEVYVS